MLAVISSTGSSAFGQMPLSRDVREAESQHS